MSDRVAGAVLVLLGVTIGLEALTFDVAFITDPVGPKALPLLAATIFVFGGTHVLLRPTSAGAWPSPATFRRIVVAVCTCLVYAVLLPLTGFMVTTTAAVAVLALLFGGSRRASFAASFTLTAILWMVFALALGLQLPVGTLFGGR